MGRERADGTTICVQAGEEVARGELDGDLSSVDAAGYEQADVIEAVAGDRARGRGAEACERAYVTANGQWKTSVGCYKKRRVEKYSPCYDYQEVFHSAG